jgi:hypothetical protein
MYAKIKKKKKPRGGFTHKFDDIPEHIRKYMMCAIECANQAVDSELYEKIIEAEKQYKEWYAEKEKEHFELKNKK